MRALVLEATGQPPTPREHAAPQVAEGEALVRLTASALNHRDVWIWQGQYPGIRHPIILGSDGVGIVESGPEALQGTRVLLNPGIGWGPDEATQSPEYEILGLPRNGTFAEYIAVPVENLHPAPSHLSDSEAAALPLGALTAWRALMTRARLQPGERVLISGVGGGVALFAMQFAIAAGAEVWVTSSSESKIARALELGASGGHLYTAPEWHRAVKGLFDVIIDSAGGDGFGSLLRLLAPAGRLAFYGGTRGKWPSILPQHLFYKQVSILASTMGSPRDFSTMLEFVNRHSIHPVVDRVFSLSEGGAAFEHLQRGVQFGKVVLDHTAPPRTGAP